MRLRPLFVASIVSFACAPAESGDPTTTTGVTGLTATGTSDGSASTTDDTGASDTGEKFDLAAYDTPGGNTGGDNMTDTCKKVDLLFVIDNSGSMEDEQQNLISSVPGFIEAMKTELADTKGYNIGVVTSDLYPWNGPGCLVEGGLVTQTGGTGSSSSMCGPYVSGKNFMTETDNLSSAFACAAQVGTQGDGNERPMQTMIAALSENLGSSGKCNEGFLRDDALLVVVIITDEEDDKEESGCLAAQSGSLGEPAQWVEQVVAAKGGVESNVVVLSLVGPDGPDPAPCPALDKCAGGIVGAEMTPRILEFTRSFTHGYVGRVCEPSYASFFQEAVSVVKSACNDFTPPG